MSASNENLYARNFYNRLKAAATAERQVSDGLKGIARETAGLKPDEIGADQKQGFNRVAETQDRTQKDVDHIVTDMTDFVKRVPNDKYEAVNKEMQEKHVVAELAELGGSVRANLGLKSVGRAHQWSDQLDAWAAMLQSQSHSQGQGGGDIDPDLMELIIAMVRAAQTEDNIRETTQLLEEKKTNVDYAAETKKLSSQQDDLYWTVDDLRDSTKFNDFKPTLKAAQDLMRDIFNDLSAPKTDPSVTSAEAAVIEILVPPSNKGAGSESKTQQLMRQIMAQTARGSSGGGNNSKSSASATGESAEGAMARIRANARNVEKTGGASNTSEWPEEYRDQLQSYFQATEGK
jgi:hypothetical protein